MKQKDLLVYYSFGVLVLHLGVIFILYLGAYWLVKIEVMDNMDIPMAEHKHYIFMHMTRQKTLFSYTYSATKVNSLLNGAEDSVVPFEELNNNFRL